MQRSTVNPVVGMDDVTGIVRAEDSRRGNQMSTTTSTSPIPRAGLIRDLLERMYSPHGRCAPDRAPHGASRAGAPVLRLVAPRRRTGGRANRRNGRHARRRLPLLPGTRLRPGRSARAWRPDSSWVTCWARRPAPRAARAVAYRTGRTRPSVSWVKARPWAACTRWRPGPPSPRGAAAAGRLSLANFGDGTTARGTFHETMVHAAAWKLPLIYFCENNAWLVGTRLQGREPDRGHRGLCGRVSHPRRHRRRPGRGRGVRGDERGVRACASLATVRR